MPAERARHEAAFARFCAVFPDAFYRSERGRMHFSPRKERQDKGRLLTAGFHNSMGYFRDDQPLYELILDEAGRRELDELWQELDFIALGPAAAACRLHLLRAGRAAADDQGARVRFHPLRGQGRGVGGEDQAAGRSLSGQRPQELAQRMAATRNRFRRSKSSFANVNANIRWVEQARLAAEPKPPRRAAEIRRARVSPAACRRPSATACSRSTARCATKADWTTKTRCATRS